MSNELTVTSLADGVAQKVKSVIFDSIPYAMIEGLIKSEFEKLTRKRYDTSPLEDIIRNELTKQCQIMAELTVQEYLKANKSDLNGQDMTENFVKQMAPLALAGLGEMFARNALQDLRNNLSQKGIYV